MTEQLPPPPPQPGWQPPAGADPRAAAKAAKAYAKASRPWFKKKRFVIPLALVAIGVVTQVGGGGGDDASTTASDTSTTEAAQPSQAPEAAEPTDAAAEDAAPPASSAPPAKAPEPKAIAVEAGAIIKEFEDNELAADSKYDGKTVKVTGVVDKVDTDFLDDDKYILRIGDGGDFVFLTVNCNDMATDELATVAKGDKVTVIGDFDDGGDLGVEVNSCSLA